MPTWKTALQIFMLLSMAGFALVILSGYWHILTLLLLATVFTWLWWRWPQIRK